MKQKLTSLMIAVLAATLVAPVVRATNDTLLQQLDDLRQEQAKYMAQQGDLQQQAESSSEGIKDLQAKLAKQQAQVQATKQRLQDITNQVVQLKRDRAAIMKESYVGGRDDTMLNALVSSSNLSEFLSRGQYTSFILDRKVSALGVVDSKLTDLEKQRRDLVTAQNGLETAISDLQKYIVDLQSRIAQNQASLDAAKQLEAALVAQTGNLNSNDRSWLKNDQPVGDTITFIGSGTEHGLGMSQYGAKGYAQRGMNYRDIITYYYTGAQITTVGDNPSVNVGGDMETYLVGVVEAEMNSNWPMEALKAQAVAARSYAYINRTRLDNTPRTQAWVGSSLQTENARRAVRETRGQVVTFQGQVVPAYFHSTSGGWTENNENVWGGSPLPWLRGVASPYETDSPHWEWRSRSYSRQQFQDILNKDDRTSVGQLQSIKIVGRGVSGRVTAVELVGSNGKKVVSGPRFKALFNVNSSADEPGLKSTLFAFI